MTIPEIETWDNKQHKWVPISEDTFTDNFYVVGPKERVFWDECNKIAKDSHK